MANMSYCRFENTHNDLRDCLDNWDLDEEASHYEIKAKKDIINLAREIVSMEDD